MAETKEVTYDPAYLESLEALDAPDGTVEFDPDASYALPAPPVEDGSYFMKFSNAGVFVEGNKVPYRSAQWKNEHRPHFEIAVVGEIIAPDQPLIDGKRVYTDMPLTTTPDPKRQNASSVGAAYKAITGKPIPGLPGLNHVKLLDEVLRGAPTGWGTVQNVLKDQDADKQIRETGSFTPAVEGAVPLTERTKAVHGQRKIMALKGGQLDGRFTGAGDHPQTHRRCAAKATLSGFKPADFTPPAKAGKGA